MYDVLTELWLGFYCNNLSFWPTKDCGSLSNVVVRCCLIWPAKSKIRVYVLSWHTVRAVLHVCMEAAVSRSGMLILVTYSEDSQLIGFPL